MLDRHSALEKSLTPNGKEMGMAKVKNSSLYCLAWRDGGELPAQLQGHKFTSQVEAGKAIQAFLRTLWDEHDKAVEKQEKAKERAARNGKGEIEA